MTRKMTCDLHHLIQCDEPGSTKKKCHTVSGYGAVLLETSPSQSGHEVFIAFPLESRPWIHKIRADPQQTVDAKMNRVCM